MLIRKKKTNRVRKQPRRQPRKAIRWPEFSRLLAPVKVLFVVSVCAAAVVVGWRLLDQPVTTISVSAPFQRVTEMQIEDEVQRGLRGGILSANLQTIRQRLSDMEWVDDVRIYRRWPATLDIRITEQIVAARWGENGLLNTRGDLFVTEARHVPAELPALAGPDGSHWQVSQRYLALHGPLLESGLRLLSVTLDSRGGWRLEMDRGIEVRLGRNAVDRRIERLLDVVTPIVVGRVETVDYIDMRYANGFAIGWNRQPAQAPQAGEENENDA